MTSFYSHTDTRNQKLHGDFSLISLEALRKGGVSIVIQVENRCFYGGSGYFGISGEK